MDIKEIVLQLAHRKCTRYNHVPVDRGIRYNFSDAHLIDLAEALIAEIAKGNEPVCEWVKSDNGNYPVQKWAKDYVAMQGDKLFTSDQVAEVVLKATGLLEGKIERLKRQSANRLIGLCKGGEDNDELRAQLATAQEQIANETAEAIAAYFRQQPHVEHFGDNIAEAIRSGAWKEFK